MKLRNWYILPLFMLLSYSGFAQVKGLSYTLSPVGQYNWFGDNSGLKDGYMVGGQFGFGFGQYVELQGTYIQGLDVQTDIDNFGQDFDANLVKQYVARDVNVKQYGGELKLNLSRSALLPYLSVGSGVQEIELDGVDGTMNKQIYLDLGAGIKFTAANRYTIGLQALRTSYKATPLTGLMTDADRTLFGYAPDSDFDLENINNYSVRASLLFYIGGRRPGELTAVDKAYYDNFSNGFRGISVPVEPSLTKIEFHEDLGFRDAWFGGVSAGINVGPLIGLRGFYMQAMDDNEVSADLDDLRLYGGEARFKLNEGKGFTPWITLGGGQIDVDEDYVARSGKTVKDQPFAMGGLGLDLPFTKFFKATGFVKSMITSADDEVENSSYQDIKSSWTYGASLNFVIGGGTKSIDATTAARADVIRQEAEAKYNVQSQQQKALYDQQIAELEAKLQEAVVRQDEAAIQRLAEEKAIAEQARNTVVTTPGAPIIVNAPAPVAPAQSGSVVKMTPAEFQNLLGQIMAQPAPQQAVAPVAPLAPATQGKSVEDAINDYRTEDKLNNLNEKFEKVESQLEAALQAAESKNEKLEEKIEELEDEQEDKLDDLEDELNDMKSKINSLRSAVLSSTMVSDSTGKMVSPMLVIEQNDKFNDLQNSLDERLDEMEDEIKSCQTVCEPSRKNFGPRNITRVNVSDNMTGEGRGFFSNFTYKGMSGFVGFNVGGNATANFGYRLHYAIGNPDSSRVEFVPETFFGLGSPSAFGITANATYAIPFKQLEAQNVRPYVGTGLGLMKVGDSDDADQLKGAFNIILGTYVNVWKGDLYVDFTGRNLFKYNQIIVGYRFPF